MIDDVTEIELLDGSVLLLNGETPPTHARRQLNEWSLIPDKAVEDEDPHRSAQDWKDLVEAGPLLVAVMEGVIANAACDAFPAAVAYLKQFFRREQVRDADAALEKARWAVETALGEVPEPIGAAEAVVDRNGVWSVDLHLGDGRKAKIEIGPNGGATRVKIR